MSILVDGLVGITELKNIQNSVYLGKIYELSGMLGSKYTNTPNGALCDDFDPLTNNQKRVNSTVMQECADHDEAMPDCMCHWHVTI